MSNTVIQDPQGIDWPLGFIDVANNGTPVNIMSVVDPSNNNAPWTPAPPYPIASQVAEYTPRCHKIFLQAFKPGNNAVAWVNNSGNVYILRSPGGGSNWAGSGNKSDTGIVVGILPPGATMVIPADEMEYAKISPYRYAVDADTNGDGVSVVLIGCSR